MSSSALSSSRPFRLASGPLAIAVALSFLLALTAVLAIAAPAQAGLEKNRKIGWGPRTSQQAAKLVNRNGWEPRPENRASNYRWPAMKTVKAWRKRSEMPYARYVDGRFRGTTDEIIQWAAHKWGINTNLMRGVATVESWWEMSTLGDNGDSFGIYQVRRPYHCWGKCEIMSKFTAFNADYYGGIIRSYFDGLQTWLKREPDNGKPYRAGDIWGSLGAWYSGRWWGPPSRPVEPYLNKVKERMAEKTWLQPYFVGK